MLMLASSAISLVLVAANPFLMKTFVAAALILSSVDSSLIPISVYS